MCGDLNDHYVDIYAIHLPRRRARGIETVKKREKGSIFSRYMKKNYLDLLDAVRQIAQLGLNYSKDPYDLERYRRLMELAAGAYTPSPGMVYPALNLLEESGQVEFQLQGVDLRAIVRSHRGRRWPFL